MATLVQRVSDLAQGIASTIKTSIVPRLLPSGGTTGQALVKSSSTDYAAGWINIPALGNQNIWTAINRFASTRMTVGALASTIDCSAASAFSGTVNGNITFTISDPPPSGIDCTIKLRIAYTSGAITWPGGVTWLAGSPPTLTAGKVLLVWLSTVDGGTSWDGLYAP